MLLMYNYVLLKMSTWYSKHVEESNNIWRINSIQCITLVVLYGQTTVCLPPLTLTLKMEAAHPFKSCSLIIITWCQNPEHHNLCRNGVSAYSFGASIKYPVWCAADWNLNRDCVIKNMAVCLLYSSFGVWASHCVTGIPDVRRQRVKFKQMVSYDLYLIGLPTGVLISP